MQQHGLINLLNSLEEKGLLAKKVNNIIQDFLDYNTKSLGKLFLILCGLMGASFISAGIFSLLAHNWDDFPKHVRGILSLLPTLIGLYFYYLALFKHKNSRVWIEASSFFLMAMIGASIALVSSTYMLDSNFHNMIKVWLVLTLPLLYLSKASGIALPYLGLALIFLMPEYSFAGGKLTIESDYEFFWIFFIAFLPHLYAAINKDSRKQGIRAIYLGWLTAIILFSAFSMAFKGGYLFWFTSIILGFYLIGKRYYNNNLSFLARPFQSSGLFVMASYLIFLTNDWTSRMAYRADNLRTIDSWDTEKYVWYFLGLTLMIGLIVYTLKKVQNCLEWNRYVIYLPILITLLLLINAIDIFADVELYWISSLVLNFYILFFAINAMIQGNRYKNIFYMLFGLGVSGLLLLVRYFDLDYSFWFKGIMFLVVGGFFFLINYLSHDEYEGEG